MRVRLSYGGKLLADARTNSDGRVKPLGESVEEGVYEIVFGVAEYFGLGGTPFLNEVVVRFGVQKGRDYHVPLLVSPYGYTTYRGS